MSDIFEWKLTEEEKPEYAIFGHSPEVIGIDKSRKRHIYVYARGSWCDDQGAEVEAPTHWHYLLRRPAKPAYSVE